MPLRGILKHSAEDVGAPRGIKWDEDNLQMTEAAKSATMKITEPKTPYIRYDSASDMVLGSTAAVPPMELTDALVDVEKEREREKDRNAERAQENANGAHPVVVKRRVSVDEWDDDEPEETMTAEEREKHDKFEAMRASHYNMRSALKEGRKMATKITEPAHAPRSNRFQDNDGDDDDDDEDEEEGVNGDTNDGDEDEDDDDEDESSDANASSQHTSIRDPGHISDSSEPFSLEMDENSASSRAPHDNAAVEQQIRNLKIQQQQNGMGIAAGQHRKPVRVASFGADVGGSMELS
ncbi:uncharacterized protein EV422DRAFT_391237 [Fimicolochytrium jonesii]|uniref:uncharacterized protein n=1 Tax=Fimicolochytrium jonesii TaxID=1396493 RepID=UPI0022FDB1BF|nr:uncharacterized protein EV422DRAFT_391237 [Fimicolochytrium jonesii]KAI8823079.1 hypothetical protein EV422DRAFT_391237 [Fimicolochytrium jonesii]